MLFRNKSSKSSNFSDLLSNTGNDAVSALGIGGRWGGWCISGWGAKSSRDVEGRSLGGKLCGRCGRVFFFPRFVESLRTPVTMLRLFTGVILLVVAVDLVFIGVDVAFSGMFSGSESVSSEALTRVCFLVTGAISFSISFWFSAKILVRSVIISFLRADLIFSKFSEMTLGDLLVPATGFSLRLISGTGVSISVETNSSTAFLFWLLVVIFGSL